MEGFKENYLGKEIVFSADQCYMLSTISRYRRNAALAAQQYIQKYQNYQSFQAFSTQGIQDGYKILKWHFDKTLDALIQMGYYDINKANAVSLYGEDIFAPWIRMEEFVTECSEESDQRVSQSEEYRALRKASRGRVVGGGFGLKGAVGGMAMAGIFNALSGLAHSGANAIGNARTRKQERDRLNQIYNSPMMVDGIRTLFTESFLQMAWFFLSYQGRYNNVPLPGTDEDLSRAEALRGNFQKIPADKQPEAAVQILMLDPISTVTYQFLLQRYQDPQGVLGRLAKAVGMDHDYGTLVDQALSPKVDETIRNLSNRMNHATVGEVDTSAILRLQEDSRQALQNICGAYGISSGASSELLTTYERRLEQSFSGELERIFRLEKRLIEKIKDVRAADQQRRTFRGTTYETVALAEQAQQFWEKACAVESACGEKASAALAEDLASLQSLMEHAPEALKPDIQEILERVAELQKEKDQAERTYLNSLFPSIEARNRAEAQYNSLMAQWLPPKKPLTSADIQAAREAVEGQEDLPEPVRQAVLEQIGRREQKLRQILQQKQADKAAQRAKSRLTFINFAYCAVALWALLFWKLFKINGADISSIDLLKLLVNQSGMITAGRGFLAMGVIVTVIQILADLKKALGGDLDEVLKQPGTILVLGLLNWGIVAFLGVTYGIAQSYFILLAISLIFHLINRAEGKALKAINY